MTVTDVAKVAHEINAAYCASIGDSSQTSWEDAPEWQKSSAIKGVQFHLDNPNASTMASHESWMEEKTRDGWKYGPVKDATKKEHPCYVPYVQLPREQQTKDFLFHQTVHSLEKFIKTSPMNQVTHLMEQGSDFLSKLTHHGTKS